MAILAVRHVGEAGAIFSRPSIRRRKTYSAVDKLRRFCFAYRVAMVVASACWRRLLIASVFTRLVDHRLSGAPVAAITPACCIRLLLPAGVIGMAVWTMNPQLENSGFAFLFAARCCRRYWR